MGERREGETKLRYCEGGSDKVYVAWLEPAGDEFHVEFAYGRYGSTLKTGRKTSAPLGREAAQATLDKLIASEVAKGYSPEDSGAAYRGTDLEGRVSGVPVQLLNAVEESEVALLIASAAHVAQEKHDGERLLVELRGGRAQGINRKGLYVGLAAAVQEAIEGLPVSSCIVDGESVGERLHAFDLLALDGEDLRERPYGERLARLNALVRGASAALEVVATAYCADSKRALFENVKARGGEGVVFKEAAAAHQNHRPHSGGVALKYKLVQSASAVVSGHHPSKRSISLALLDEQGQEVPVGNVTVPPNQDIPAVGSVVEVRYLYAYRSGSLFQPVLLGRRSDMAREDCVLGQLKYKAEPVAA
jgi:bifunctional non-homologous end joining protein LigD